MCRSLGVVPPRLVFWNRASSACDHDNCVLVLPQPELWNNDAERSGIDKGEEGYYYWIRVWHEVAHYLHGIWAPVTGHQPEFYAILTALVMSLGIPMGVYVEDETSYKPRQLRAGMKQAAASLLVSYKGATK